MQGPAYIECEIIEGEPLPRELQDKKPKQKEWFLVPLIP